jgi:hypothetical protein
MPETMAMELGSQPVFLIADITALNTVPIPQPGHQICGILSVLRRESIG